MDEEVFVGMFVGAFITIMICVFGFVQTNGFKTDSEVELLSNVCEYIYENESQEVYLKYCK